MRHYDPWIFGMLWEIEHREELRHLANARLARQAVEWQAARSSEPDCRRAWSRLCRLISGFMSSVWLWLRRPRREAEGGA
jgi:hypothetical protein